MVATLLGQAGSQAPGRLIVMGLWSRPRRGSGPCCCCCRHPSGLSPCVCGCVGWVFWAQKREGRV